MLPADLVGLAGVPLIQAVLELVKVTFPGLPTRFYPSLSVAIGIVLNELLALLTHADPGGAALVGFVAGIAASGLYAWGKARELA